ncbi:MAG: hypothetical protein HYZ54_13890 [Ignavibacteriae bacterium]|nr:hypothetical protein [Ignavibacteriota bacterium]
MKIVLYSVLIFTLMYGNLFARINDSDANSLMQPDSTYKIVSQMEATLYSGVNIGLGFGYGFKQNYDFGVNVRAGLSSESRWYLGGLFNYHFGRSITQTFDTITVSLEKFAYSISGELGYDVLIEKKAILRPSVTIGFITFRDITDISKPINIKANETASHLLISPGMFFQFPLSHDIFWGAELRYNVVSGDGDYNSFELYTNFLFRF